MQKPSVIIGLVVTGLIASYFLFPQIFQNQPENYAPVSPYQLLDANDVRETIKTAVDRNDEALFNQEVERIVSFAEAMPLAPDDIKFLQSKEAEDYLRFHAKRSLFDEAVVDQFISLGTLDNAKASYPQAKDKFAHADAIMQKRDALFANIVQTLQQDGLNAEQADATARQLWRERWRDRFDRERVLQLIGQ